MVHKLAPSMKKTRWSSGRAFAFSCVQLPKLQWCVSERFSVQNQTTVLDWGLEREKERVGVSPSLSVCGFSLWPTFCVPAVCSRKGADAGLHASSRFDFIVTMLLAACLSPFVCVRRPHLIDATSFDFPSVSCDGGLDGRPRWVSHKVFMSSVCLSLPLSPCPFVCPCAVHCICSLCAKFVDGFYDQPQLNSTRLNSAQLGWIRIRTLARPTFCSYFTRC